MRPRAVEALGLEPGIVAVVGSGGKTSLLRVLGGELHASGERVVLTTTTHILAPAPGEGRVVLLGGRVPGAEFADRLRGPRPVWVAGRARAGGKLKGLEPVQVQGLVKAAKWVVVEADGAKGRPLKAWAEYEPVIPPETGVVVVVVGAWGIGKALGAGVVHRPQLFARAAGMEEGQRLQPAHVARVITGPCGPLRAISPGTKALAVVNHLGERSDLAWSTAKALGESGRFARVVVGRVHKGELRVAWMA